MARAYSPIPSDAPKLPPMTALRTLARVGRFVRDLDDLHPLRVLVEPPPQVLHLEPEIEERLHDVGQLPPRHLARVPAGVWGLGFGRSEGEEGVTSGPSPSGLIIAHRSHV